eukprot:5507682-Pleurochrysis_carterae.AAC.1
MALTLAKRHSVPEDSHKAETDSSESLKLGAQRTSLRVIATLTPASFKADSGKSPMAVQRWGRPSIPATRSSQSRMFTRCRLRLGALRCALVAIKTRAGVAIGAECWRAVGVTATRGSASVAAAEQARVGRARLSRTS